MLIVLIVLIALLAASAAPAQARQIGPDHVAGDGVVLLENIRLNGSGMGGALVGDRLLLTGPSHLTVFDVGDPRSPALVGAAPLGAANESESVAGDGRWAAVAEAECLDPAVRGGCIAVFDVTGAPARIASLAQQVQTVSCMLGCRYLWATGENAIVDMADPSAPKVVGTFLSPDDPRLEGICYSVREARPGVAMLSCDPAYAMSTLPEHGGTPQRPVIIAQADTGDFRSTALGGVPHSAHWPLGRDRFMMTTTETPFSGTCSDDIGAFVLWDARPVLEGRRGFVGMNLWRPANGTYVDGRSPYNAVGCSAHFFNEHPTFRDGGLVTVSALENGLRFLQITPGGEILERSYFLGAGGTSAIPLWHPNGRIVYVVDYTRGLDVLEYTGDLYVPPPAPAAAPAAPPAPASAPAPRRFRVLGVIRNRRGRATIAVETPGPGRLVARPRARGARFKRLVARVRQAGLATLTVAPGPRARHVLRRRGRLTVRVRITWRPRRGSARTATQRVVLRARR